MFENSYLKACNLAHNWSKNHFFQWRIKKFAEDGRRPDFDPSHAHYTMSIDYVFESVVNSQRGLGQSSNGLCAFFKSMP